MIRLVEWFLIVASVVILIGFIACLMAGCTLGGQVKGSVAANGELIDFDVRVHPRLFPTSFQTE